jgi:phosphatidate phosphatase APP1
VDAVLRRRGWGTRVLGHTGYGSHEFVRVLGRVLLTRRPDLNPRADAGAGSAELRRADDERRGWRAFITAPAMNVPVTVTLGDRVVETSSDRSGYIDVRIPDHGLEPGLHEVTLAAVGAESIEASVLIVGADEKLGLISDIDDTVISTSLPRPMIAAWNTFVKNEDARHVVPGMATMYRALLEEHPGAPMVYVSTGAWNTAPTLTRFLRRNGYPAGPLLLTDWGPTNTGWFRSGQDHKRACLHRLANEFPGIKWVLIGDDGQHDPRLYGEFAEQRPDRVAAVAIRELTPQEQVLSHGIPVSLEEFEPLRAEAEVPICRSGDGYGLRPQLEHVLEMIAEADSATGPTPGVGSGSGTAESGEAVIEP